MNFKRNLSAAVVYAAIASVPATASAETFEWIMESISSAGSLPNGDGHNWTFARTGDGWQVVGKDGRTAEVTDSAENVIEISHFPKKWKANGPYRFSKSGTECRLRASYSRHNMNWEC